MLPLGRHTRVNTFTLDPANMKKMLRMTGGIASTLVLALLPKCPLCVAAYVSMLTGLGVSVAVAAIIKESLAGVCILTLGLLLISGLFRVARENRKQPHYDCCALTKP